MVACKELTNFHWRFPDRKRSPSFRNHPIWSSWKPSLLALRVSPSVYERISRKLVCGTKVATPIRSLFCNAALSCLISCLVPSGPFHAQFLVCFTMGDWNLSGQMDCLQKPKDLIDLGPSGGQVASFFPNSHVHVAPERHTWSQCKWWLFFLFPAPNLESGLWSQLTELKDLGAKFSL